MANPLGDNRVYAATEQDPGYQVAGVAQVPAVSAAEEPFGALGEVGRAWGVLFAFGLITIALGIVITFRPGGTVRVLAVVLGVWLLVLGALRLIEAVLDRGVTGSTRLGLAVVGLLAILVGLLVLHHSFETIAVIGFIVGLFWVAGGLATLFAGLGPDATGRRAPLILLGLASTGVGIVCLIYPGLSLSILAVLLGIGVIVYGVIDIAASLQLRRLEKA